MMTMIDPGQTGQKVETYTYPGPLTMPIRNIIFPFMVVSMVITNASSQTLFLDMSDIASFSTAKIIVPPTNVYHVHGWFDNHLFINASGNLTASEFITIQACDHMTTLPMASLAATFIPSSSTPGDSTPNPTAPSNISFQMVFNPSTGLWERQRVPSADNLPTTGIAASGNMVFNASTGQWDRVREPLSDGSSATGMITASHLLYNAVNGLWYRPRQGDVTGATVTDGVQATVPLTWDSSGSRFLLNQNALSDAIGGVRAPSTLPFVYDSVGGVWNRIRQPNTDAMAITGFVGVGPLVFDNSFGWSRMRSAVADAQGNPGYAGIQPLLWNGGSFDRSRSAISDAQALTGLAGTVGMLWNGANFDFPRRASATNISTLSGTGVALVAHPGNWSLLHAAGLGAKASATRAAVAGTRHVATCIVADLVTNVAAAAAPLTVVVRDGVSGAGTILFSADLAINMPLNHDVDKIVVPGISLVGSVNTAMTIEFNAAAANIVQTVNLFGYEAG